LLILLTIDFSECICNSYLVSIYAIKLKSAYHFCPTHLFEDKERKSKNRSYTMISHLLLKSEKKTNLCSYLLIRSFNIFWINFSKNKKQEKWIKLTLSKEKVRTYEKICNLITKSKIEHTFIDCWSIVFFFFLFHSIMLFMCNNLWGIYFLKKQLCHWVDMKDEEIERKLVINYCDWF
jgi:hypothetical protein